jgi:hypothetical protein
VSHTIELLGIEPASRKAMAENIISKNISIKEIRRYKHQLSLAEDKEKIEFHNADAEHTTTHDKNYSNYDLIFPNNIKHHTLKFSQHKIAFLKKVQLSLKTSLSRADSLIHEYEELMAPETENDGSDNKDPKIPGGYDH